MTEKVPGYIKPTLKKVGDADTFQLQGGHPIPPPGKYVLSYDYIEETVGEISESPTIDLEQVSSNSATYQEISKVVVSKKKGYLDAIALGSDTPGTAQWRLTIRNSVKFEDKKTQSLVNLDLQGIDLAEGDEVLLEGKSNGSTTIIFDGLIQVREVGSP